MFLAPDTRDYHRQPSRVPASAILRGRRHRCPPPSSLGLTQLASLRQARVSASSWRLSDPGNSCADCRARGLRSPKWDVEIRASRLDAARPVARRLTAPSFIASLGECVELDARRVTGRRDVQPEHRMHSRADSRVNHNATKGELARPFDGRLKLTTTRCSSRAISGRQRPH